MIGSPSNVNFLGSLELLFQFDTFLAAHLEKYGNKGKGSVSCLSSSTTCDQIKAIIGKEVLSTIIVRKSRQLNIIQFLSTPPLL